MGSYQHASYLLFNHSVSQTIPGNCFASFLTLCIISYIKCAYDVCRFYDMKQYNGNFSRTDFNLVKLI